MQQVKHIALKIKLLTEVKDYLNNRKNGYFRTGICVTLRGIVDGYIGTKEWNKDMFSARNDILDYIDKALGSHAYLEGWQRGEKRRAARLAKRPNDGTWMQSYLDRIQWVEWMIEQYKQIDKEQKAKK